jgi:hypothetical protein
MRRCRLVTQAAVASAIAVLILAPDTARAQVRRSASADGAPPASGGGGFWVYTGRFVTQDSVEGTAVLRDWPQPPAGQKPPAGTFALARRAPGA